ncbi:geranylgeranyl reductase family protein [Methanobacterium sp.]|uniref:geranylgeranyl reductase family protein n=1 Tax=Methanobacterium sp. TaxID=2164 RepID=UPI003D651408
MNMNEYDVAVVGAGPVGSTFARYVAEKGLKVAIFEKKKEVGVPLQCAGLLGKKIKDVNILPDEYIINEVHGAYLHSPSNTILNVNKKEPVGYVLDRIGYDKYLAQLAVDKGAELFLNHRVEHIDIKNGEIFLKNKKITAEVIVGADGYSSIISKEFNNTRENVQAVQYLVDTGKDTFKTDYVHLYVDSKISPGFLWIIPLSKSTARVGLFADIEYHELSNILKEFITNNEYLKDSTILKKYPGVIPVNNYKQDVVKDRSILIGDAASQVKPTTGGGLIIGFVCAKIAADVVYGAINSEDITILKNYQEQYHKMYKNELKIQHEVQKTFASLNNDDLDSMFLKLKEKNAEEMISKYGDIDSQSPLVKEMIKTGLLFSILPKILSRKISNLWK